MAKATTRRSGGRSKRKSTLEIRVESRKGSTRAEAKRVASDGRSVKRRVSKLSVDTFNEKGLSLDDMPRVVHDVLSGAVDAVDRNIPQSRNNVLREVFDGLSEGFNRVNRAAGVMMSGDGIAGRRNSKSRGNAARNGHAGDDFLGAVSSFASRASRRVRDELNSYVDSAERQTGGRGHARDEASKRRRSGDDGMMETAASAARAGMRSARRAVSDVAEMAGGMVDGMMERTSGSTRKTAPRRKRPTPAVGRTVARTVRKATGTRKAPKRRGR